MTVFNNSLIESIDGLLYEDRLHILKILLNAGIKTHESGDGTRILINAISQKVEDQIKTYVEKCLDIPKEFRI